MLAWQDHIRNNAGTRDPVDQGYRNILADMTLWALKDYNKLYQAVTELRAAEANGKATECQRKAVIRAALSWLGHTYDGHNLNSFYSRLLPHHNIVTSLGENVLVTATETLQSNWMKTQLLNLDINPTIAHSLPEIATNGNLPKSIRRVKKSTI